MTAPRGAQDGSAPSVSKPVPAGLGGRFWKAVDGSIDVKVVAGYSNSDVQSNLNTWQLTVSTCCRCRHD